MTASMNRMKRSLQSVVIKGQTASTKLSWGTPSGRLQVPAESRYPYMEGARGRRRRKRRGGGGEGAR